MFSITLVTIALLIIEHMPQNLGLILAIVGISGISIFLNAPAADENKPLSETERKAYRKKARTIFAIEVCVLFICFALGFREIALSIVISLATAGGMVGIKKDKKFSDSN